MPFHVHYRIGFFFLQVLTAKGGRIFTVFASCASNVEEDERVGCHGYPTLWPSPQRDVGRVQVTLETVADLLVQARLDELEELRRRTADQDRWGGKKNITTTKSTRAPKAKPKEK